MRPSRSSLLLCRLVRVVGRGLAAAVLLALVLALPLPRLSPWFFQMVYVPLAVLSFIIYVGKLLLDTFFYDHYKP